jgi:hypothetical protein
MASESPHGHGGGGTDWQPAADPWTVEGQAPAAPAGPYGGYPPVQPPAGPYGAPSYQPLPPGGAYPGPYGPAYGYPYVPPRRTNGLAIASMVLGILWLYWIGSILALVFGYIARNQIRERGDSGDGMAIAGIVLGWVGVGVLGLAFVVAVASSV